MKHKRKMISHLIWLVVLFVKPLASQAQLGNADNATLGTVPNQIYDALCGTNIMRKDVRLNSKMEN